MEGKGWHLQPFSDILFAYPHILQNYRYPLAISAHTSVLLYTFSSSFSTLSFYYSCQYLPAKVCASIPPFTGTLFFTNRGKEWKTPYNVVDQKGRTWKASIKWRDFAIDNHLKEGDACVFELTERSNTVIKFRVQILKGDFPSQLLNSVDGVTADKPIVL